MTNWRMISILPLKQECARISGFKTVLNLKRMKIQGVNIIKQEFEIKLNDLKERNNAVVAAENKIDENWYNGIFDRYENCVLTNEHIPLEWRYDLNYETNSKLLERIGVNAVFNSRALYFEGKYALVAPVEGYDRKSYFAVARSETE